MPLTLRYDLTGMGWATAWIGNGETEIECAVEWDVDTLAEILREACYHLEGNEERREREVTRRDQGHTRTPPTYTERGIVFFTWPHGQYVLEFDRQSKIRPRDLDSLTVLRETPLTGWLAWRPTFEDQGEECLIFTWETTAGDLADLAAGIATDLLTRYGFRGYAERWFQFDFPLALYARLQMLRGERTLTIVLDGTLQTPV